MCPRETRDSVTWHLLVNVRTPVKFTTTLTLSLRGLLLSHTLCGTWCCANSVEGKINEGMMVAVVTSLNGNARRIVWWPGERGAGRVVLIDGPRSPMETNRQAMSPFLWTRQNRGAPWVSLRVFRLSESEEVVAANRQQAICTVERRRGRCWNGFLHKHLRPAVVLSARPAGPVSW